MAPREIADSDDEDELMKGTPQPSPISEQHEQRRISMEIPEQSVSEDINFSDFLDQPQSYNGFTASQQSQRQSQLQSQPVCRPFNAPPEHDHSMSPTQPLSALSHMIETAAANKSAGSTDRVRKEIEDVQGQLFRPDQGLQLVSAQLDGAYEDSLLSPNFLRRSKTFDIDSSSPRARDKTQGKSKKRRTYADKNRSMSSGWIPTSSRDSPLGDGVGAQAQNLAYVESPKIHHEAPDDVLPGHANVGSQDQFNQTPVNFQCPDKERDINGMTAYQSSIGNYQTFLVTDPDRNPFADESSEPLRDPNRSGKVMETFKSFKGGIVSSMAGTATAAYEAQATINGDTTLDQLDSNEPSHGKVSNTMPAESDTGADGDKEPVQKGKRKRQKSTASVTSQCTSASFDGGSGKTIDRKGSEESKNQHEKEGRKDKGKTSTHEGPVNDSSVEMPKFAEQELQSGRTSRDSDSSAVKDLSSESNLSDEILIGLPKEQYQPRPSRYGRRGSIKVLIEDTVQTREGRSDKKATSRMATQVPNSADEESSLMLPPPLKTPSKKSGKKARVKRAKTSAVALKTESMIDEDDEDVIYMDEQPAKVQMKVPNDPRLGRDGTKKEEDYESRLEDPDVNNNEDVPNLDSSKESPSVRILVNIPTPSKPSSEEAVEGKSSKFPAEAKTEPRKRGRPKKKAIEMVTEVGTSNSDAEVNATDVKVGVVPGGKTSRPALEEKTTNISPSNRSLTKDGQMCNFDGFKVSEAAQIPAVAGSNSNNASTDIDASTLKPTEEVSKHAVEPETPPSKDRAVSTGPKQHSPINPIGGLSKFRVGLSKRARIPSLLKRVGKDSKATTIL